MERRENDDDGRYESEKGDENERTLATIARARSRRFRQVVVVFVGEIHAAAAGDDARRIAAASRVAFRRRRGADRRRDAPVVRLAYHFDFDDLFLHGENEFRFALLSGERLEQRVDINFRFRASCGSRSANACHTSRFFRRLANAAASLHVRARADTDARLMDIPSIDRLPLSAMSTLDE